MRSKSGKSNLDIVQDYLSGERPFVQVGYTGKKYHNEGEVWKDANGVEWQRKNGRNVKISKSQGDIIREAMGERKCKCGMSVKWGNKYDQVFFAKTGMCQDCLIEYETKLRIAGIYHLYEACKVYSNQIGFLKDAKAKIEETIEYFSKNDGTIEILCNSEGFREKFHGTNKETILENAKNDLVEATRLLKAVTKNKNEAKKELKKRAAEFKIKVYV